MRCELVKSKCYVKLLVGVSLLCAGGAAGAVTTLIGGGSTLPTFIYTGQRQPPSPATVGVPLVPTAGSLFGVYTVIGGNPVTYCPTGSGLGKRIFAGNAPSTGTATDPCFATSPTGFNTSGPPIAQAHFAASEAPLSVSEFNNYRSGHANALPEQFPAVAGAVAIAFNKTGLNTLTLSEGQVCAIFSGQITTWDELSIATGPIHLVYRSDESGTSFSLLNHLSAVCAQSANVLPGKVAATQFKTMQRYADPTGVFSGGAQAYFSSYFGPVGMRGNGDVADYIRSNDGTLGYVETSYATTAPIRVASVRNTHSGAVVNPLTGFGATPLAVVPLFDKALADTTDMSGRPVLVPSPVSTQCVAVVEPGTYADPLTGYPIVAVSYLLGNQSANGADATAVRTLLGSPYKNSPVRTAMKPVSLVGTGYAWLTHLSVLDSTDPVTGIQARINSCIN